MAGSARSSGVFLPFAKAIVRSTWTIQCRCPATGDRVRHVFGENLITAYASDGPSKNIARKQAAVETPHTAKCGKQTDRHSPGGG